MSNAVFPSLAGLMPTRSKTPIWKTLVRESASGKELRGALMTTPRWRYNLSYEFLREGHGNTELQQILGLFNQCHGAWDTFLYLDPEDYAVTNQQFGLGDGVSTQFQLVRSYGLFVEPIAALNGSATIYKNGVQQYQTARTNLLTYSSNLGNATQWSQINMVPVSSYTTAPDGTATAIKAVPNTTNGQHRIEKSLSLTAGSSYTASVYAKAAEYPRLYIRCANDTGGAIFDLINGIVASVSAGTTAFISNEGGGWYRCSVKSTATITGMAVNVRFNVNSATTETFAGDGVSGIYLWGAQLEQSTSPTTYIQTTTSAVTVTDCTVSTSGLITFPTAPALADVLTWTGNYYWRCRFTKDETEFARFMQDLYEAKKIEFITVKGES